MSIAKVWPLCLGLVICLAGCHKRVAPAASAVVPERPAAPPSAAPARPPAPPLPVAAAPPRSAPALGEDELFRRKSLAELNAERPLSDSFFDYDQSGLGDEARRTLQRDAAWLAKWPGTAIKVEGH